MAYTTLYVLNDQLEWMWERADKKLIYSFANLSAKKAQVKNANNLVFTQPCNIFLLHLYSW